MLVEVPNGGSVNVTTAISASDTDLYAIESTFDTPTTNTPVYLRLSASDSQNPDDYSTVLLPDQNSIHSFKSVQGVAGQSLFAYRPSTSRQESVFIRVTTSS